MFWNDGILEYWKHPAASSVSATLQFTVEDRLGNRFTKESNGVFGSERKIWEMHRQRFEEAAKKSGLLTAADAPANNQSVNLKITAKLNHSAAGDQATLISMMGLIPTWPNVYANVTIVARTPWGKTFRYDLNDERVRINWLPLILMAPFKPATSDFNAVVENMYMTAFIKMQNDGVLPKDKPLGHLSPAETAELAAQTKRDEAILIRELVLPGNVKMELPRCPAGTFTMGSPADETGCRNNETPHQVTLSKPFWMGKTEVTQAQWRSLMGNNPSKSEGDDLPVETVSSVEAEAFCRKLTLHLQEKNLLSHDYEQRQRGRNCTLDKYNILWPRNRVEYGH